MKPVTAKEARLVARASADVQELIKCAAELSGATISQFIVDAAVTKANALIESMNSIKLSLESANALFDALENPPAPNSTLLAAADRYKRKREIYENRIVGQKHSPA
jgi:uncharacterized protein (DUF1778 family)